ncbi:MAG: type II secretion system F family protein [Desulfuromonadaceae bacterium]|nr:type II secretion system F family protein [Desulfuromonadaceae bacterium]
MTTFLNNLYRLIAQYEQWLILALIFLAIITAGAAVVFFFFSKNTVGDRVSRLLHKEKEAPSKQTPRLLQDESKGFISRKLINPLQRLAAPKEEELQQKTRLRLIQAGFRSRQAYRNYWAAKFLFAVVPAAIYFFRTMFFAATPKDYLIVIALMVVGYFIPNLFVLQCTQKRQQRILRTIPDALDMMVVCVEAGLGLDMTLKKVGDEVRPICKDLSDEFYLTNLEVNAGKSREESLKSMGLRTGVQEVQNLMALLVQTVRFGTSLAKSLRVHAEGMRTRRRQLAEERAAKASLKLLFPLLFFIFPALFIVIIGPAAIRIIKHLLPLAGGQ